MTVRELNRDQLIELKQSYLTEKYNGDVSYNDLADADELVSDATIYRYYEGYMFSPDDFVSSSGQDLYNDELVTIVIKNVRRGDASKALEHVSVLVDEGYANGIPGDIVPDWYLR